MFINHNNREFRYLTEQSKTAHLLFRENSSGKTIMRLYGNQRYLKTKNPIETIENFVLQSCAVVPFTRLSFYEAKILAGKPIFRAVRPTPTG